MSIRDLVVNLDLSEATAVAHMQRKGETSPFGHQVTLEGGNRLYLGRNDEGRPYLILDDGSGEPQFADSNLFVVDLDSDYDIANIHRIDERTTETVTISDFRRLLPGHIGVQRVSKPAPAVATSEAQNEAAPVASTSW